MAPYTFATGPSNSGLISVRFVQCTDGPLVDINTQQRGECRDYLKQWTWMRAFK